MFRIPSLSKYRNAEIPRLLINHLYVIEPQGVAHRAYVGAAVAAVELQYEVGGLLVGRGPSLLQHGHVLAPAVQGVVGALAADQAHPLAVVGLLAYVAVVDGVLLSLHPSVGALAEAHPHGAHAQGVYVALGVLPPLLQQAHALAHVAARYGARLAESGLLDARVGPGGGVLVVELQGPGPACEGYAHVDLRHGVLRAGYGLQHGAQV